MSTTPNFDLARNKRHIDRLKVIDPSDEIEALKAAVPMFRNAKKTEYLVLRSVSFSHDECLSVIGAKPEEYSEWLADGDEFGIWAVGSGMLHLQQGVGEQVLKAKFLRNVFLVMANDSRVLTMRQQGLAMTADDMKDARDASTRYSAQNIVAMMRVLDKDLGEYEVTPQTINIQLNVDPEIAKVYGEKRLVSQHLLDKFTRKTVVLDETGRIVE